MLNTAEQGLKFLDDIGSSNATVHLDSYHMKIGDAFAALDRIGYDGMQLATAARRFVVEHLAEATT